MPEPFCIAPVGQAIVFCGLPAGEARFGSPTFLPAAQTRGDLRSSDPLEAPAYYDHCSGEPHFGDAEIAEENAEDLRAPDWPSTKWAP